jgi:hypothetical protein
MATLPSAGARAGVRAAPTGPRICLKRADVKPATISGGGGLGCVVPG